MEEKKETWIKKNWVTILVFIICITFFVKAILIYRSQFGTEFSNSKEEFGQFGDYLNSITGIINLLLLAYISFAVSGFEDKRLDKSLNVQRQITLSQMMNDKLIPLSNILDKINSSFDYGLSDNIKIVKDVQKEFDLFGKNCEYLFEHKFKEVDFKTNTTLLVKSFDNIIEAINNCTQILIEIKRLDEENSNFDLEKVLGNGLKERKSPNQILNEIEDKNTKRTELGREISEKYRIARNALDDYLKYKDEYIKRLSLYILYQLKK